MCFLSIGRHDGLIHTESNERLLNRICDLLDDGKYRNVKHGQIHYLQCCKRLVVHYEKMKDKANLQLSLQKYENFVDELGLQAPKLRFKVLKYSNSEEIVNEKVDSQRDDAINELLTPFNEAEICCPFEWIVEVAVGLNFSKESIKARQKALDLITIDQLHLDRSKPSVREIANSLYYL